MINQRTGNVALFRTAVTMVWTCVAIVSCRAQEPSFSGQRITIVVGTPVGGAYDAYARLASRHLGRLLAGNPGITVQNMPGAGSLVAANWLANVAPSDGTALGILASEAVFEPLFGNSRARFDFRKFKWLGGLNDYTGVAMVARDTPFHEAKDLVEHEAVVGGASASSDTSLWPNLLNGLIGTKFRVVSGYDGSTGVSLALERGEVQAIVGQGWDSLTASHSDWLRDGKIRVLMQLRLQRLKELVNVPTALEFATDSTREELALFVARQSLGRPFVAPPNTPESVSGHLRQAFVRLLDDPEFLQDARQSRLAIQGMSSETIANLVQRVAATPVPVIDRASADLHRLEMQ